MGNRFRSYADSEEGTKSGVADVAAVETEDELVEAGLEVFWPQAAIDPERPGFEVAKHAVNPGRDDMGRYRADGMGADDMGADDMRIVAVSRHSGVSLPAVRPGGRGGCDVGVDETIQAGGGDLGDGSEADAAGSNGDHRRSSESRLASGSRPVKSRLRRHLEGAVETRSESVESQTWQGLPNMKIRFSFLSRPSPSVINVLGS